MIRYTSQKQLNIEGFDTPFEKQLDANNRWVKLGQCIPWDDLAAAYHRNLSAGQGRPSKDARLVIGAVIIKHKLCLSDEETVQQIRENPYLQYFVGLAGYQNQAPFVPSLLVEIRRRMGNETFAHFHQAILDAMDARRAKANRKGSDRQDDDPSGQGGHGPVLEDVPEPQAADDQREVTEGHAGKLILDATVVEQAIRYPTDLSLLNESREISEKIIDVLYPQTQWDKKPRTYRQQARKAYLAIVKRRRPGARIVRKGNKQQLQYVRRNLKHIDRLLDAIAGDAIPLPGPLLHKYWVIQQLYAQQAQMHQTKTKRCDDRIVSIHQPHVRPMVRGKANKKVEFGAKLSVSLNGDGIAGVDHIRWDAYHEGLDLPAQVETYKQRYGHYPEAVLGDPLYGTRDNRAYLKSKKIRFAGKPLGRPAKLTTQNREELKRLKQQRREEYRQRIPIEGKFGQGKSGYGLGYIRAKTARTSEAWINSIFLVMNLLVLLKVFIWLHKKIVEYAKWALRAALKYCLAQQHPFKRCMLG